MASGLGGGVGKRAIFHSARLEIRQEVKLYPHPLIEIMGKSAQGQWGVVGSTTKRF
jgi:hypothetical protein